MLFFTSLTFFPFPLYPARFFSFSATLILFFNANHNLVNLTLYNEMCDDLSLGFIHLKEKNIYQITASDAT